MLNNTKNIIKESLLTWILEIDSQEIPSDIIALNFGLTGPDIDYCSYGVFLYGSTKYSKSNSSWANFETYSPTPQVCPNLEIKPTLELSDFIQLVTESLIEISDEYPNTKVFQVLHVTCGYYDDFKEKYLLDVIK